MRADLGQLSGRENARPVTQKRGGSQTRQSERGKKLLSLKEPEAQEARGPPGRVLLLRAASLRGLERAKNQIETLRTNSSADMRYNYKLFEMKFRPEASARLLYSQAH